MAGILGGDFIMGRDSNDPDSLESPEHKETVNSFYLDKNEVTNKQYGRFVSAAGHRLPLHWKEGWFQPEDGMRPVTHVTWTDADTYCRWIGKRLPTEKEWEYAACGGAEARVYPWGHEWTPGFANVDSGASIPAPIGMFLRDRSIFEVWGLAGNVSEWVADRMVSYDPAKRDFPSSLRVIRGGNFKDKYPKSRASYRFSEYPDWPENLEERKAFQETMDVVGFRCAKDATQ